MPTRKEINVFDSLDERSACDHFLGKSFEEAEQLFRKSSLYYQEDLMWMGPVAFRCYVRSLIRYIQSDFATGDSDIIRCFAGLLEFRLQGEADELAVIADQLATDCTYILENLDRFSLDAEIDGDVNGRLTELKTRFQRITSAKPDLGHTQ